jgi:hypothetical protein
MRRILTLLFGLVFVVNYALGNITFVAFLGWYDTGHWDSNSDGYSVVAASGILCGCLALIIELRLFRKAKFWPRNLFLFVFRLMATSVLYVAVSFAISSSWIILTTAKEFDKAMSFLFIVPLIMAFYLLMITPFGAFVGFINSILLRLTRAFQW